MKEESGVLRVRQGLSRDVLGAWGPDRGTLNAESQTGNTRKGSHVTSPSGLILQKEAYRDLVAFSRPHNRALP